MHTVLEQYDASEVTVRGLILLGQSDDPLVKNKKLVAKSECKFVCPNRASLERCIAHLRESDEHLRNRPEEMMLWTWDKTYLELPPGEDGSNGGVIILGVSWYDEKFFEDHRSAYTNPSHLEKYLQIGLDSGAITVSHWRFVEEGQL